MRHARLMKAVGAGHGLFVPIEVLLERSDEEDRWAHGVCANGSMTLEGGTTALAA